MSVNSMQILSRQQLPGLYLALVLCTGCGGSAADGPRGASGSGGVSGSGGASGSGGTAGSGGSAAGGNGSGGAAAGGSGGAAGQAGAGGADVSCSEPSDCVVVPVSCCGSCGVPARGDAQAVRADRAADVSKRACAGGGGCPACAGVPDPTLIATCDAGRCTLVDLLKHPTTACRDDGDCRLRTNQCCGCPGPAPIGFEHLIAVSSEDYRSLVCDQAVACLGCEPQFPEDALAVCNFGHCQVSWYIDGQR